MAGINSVRGTIEPSQLGVTPMPGQLFVPSQDAACYNDHYPEDSPAGIGIRDPKS